MQLNVHVRRHTKRAILKAKDESELTFDQLLTAVFEDMLKVPKKDRLEIIQKDGKRRIV